jgi:hypothetical protein
VGVQAVGEEHHVERLLMFDQAAVEEEGAALHDELGVQVAYPEVLLAIVQSLAHPSWYHLQHSSF